MNACTGIRRIGVIGGLMLLGPGCEQRALDAAETAAGGQLGEVTMADGSRLTFLEPHPGLVVASAEGGRGSAAIALFQGHEGSIPELYQKAAGAQAPQPLLEAQTRLELARQAAAGVQSGADDGGELAPARAATVGPVATIRQPLTAAEFSAGYCVTNHDFLYCYTNVTGTWIVTRRTGHVHTCVEAISGNIHRRLEYDTGAFAGWQTYVSATVSQGTMACTTLQEGNRANYRFTVDQATGDTWHGTMYGAD
jgi:hypothetical protein